MKNQVSQTPVQKNQIPDKLDYFKIIINGDGSFNNADIYQTSQELNIPVFFPDREDALKTYEAKYGKINQSMVLTKKSAYSIEDFEKAYKSAENQFKKYESFDFNPLQTKSTPIVINSEYNKMQGIKPSSNFIRPLHSDSPIVDGRIVAIEKENILNEIFDYSPYFLISLFSGFIILRYFQKKKNSNNVKASKKQYSTEIETINSRKIEEDLFQIESTSTPKSISDSSSNIYSEGNNQTVGPRNKELMYKGIISKGITDIPFGNYTLEKFAGLTNKGDARRVIYRNITTNELYVVFGIDSYPELWNQDQSELLANLNFGFSKNTGKLTRYK